LKGGTRRGGGQKQIFGAKQQVPGWANILECSKKGNRKMKRLLLAATLGIAVIAPAYAGDLTATITQAKLLSGDSYNVLLVINNQTAQAFRSTKWSCVFYSNNEIVGEDSIYVDNVESGKKTPKSTMISSFRPFDKSECRLLRDH
jgi:hypothetical protein